MNTYRFSGTRESKIPCSMHECNLTKRDLIASVVFITLRCMATVFDVLFSYLKLVFLHLHVIPKIIREQSIIM